MAPSGFLTCGRSVDVRHILKWYIGKLKSDKGRISENNVLNLRTQLINLTIYVFFDMRRLLTLLFFFSLICGAVYAQQMTDDQVVQYVKDAQKTGKSQQEITTELMRRGVTKEQVERIRMKYENGQQGQRQGVAATDGAAVGNNVIRERAITEGVPPRLKKPCS